MTYADASSYEKDVHELRYKMPVIITIGSSFVCLLLFTCTYPFIGQLTEHDIAAFD